MKNLIYQVWAGKLRPGCEYSSKLVKEYADRIGADYRLDIDPMIASSKCDVPMYFEWLNPLLDDSFLEYDNVAVLDLDVFPIDGLDEDIFQVSLGYDCGICTEPFQGKYRASTTIGGHINSANDDAWAKIVKRLYDVDLPCDKDGYVKVYNAGVVVFSKEALKIARRSFIPFQQYINDMRKAGLGRFYTVDQNYFHVMMCKYYNYVEMHRGWNSYVHYVRGPLSDKTPVYDGRPTGANGKTRLVHIQLSSADYFEDQKLYDITNKPMSEWNLS